MHRWKIGDVRVTRVQELEAPGLQWLLPDAVPENLESIPWLAPHYVDEHGQALASVHALVVEASGRRIVVDTCVGNDKERPIPPWNLRQGPFLKDLETAGFPTDSIDTVLCTHLHVDHVGWNTRLVEGRWLPTFPRARYLLGRTEWEHWSADGDPLTRTILADSVRPVFDAGLVDLVGSDHRVADEVWLEPTPGHTPGTLSFLFPVAEGGRSLTVMYAGGTAFNFPPSVEAFAIYRDSMIHSAELARTAGATVLMSNHTEFDRAYDRARIAQLRRLPGERHPYETDVDTVVRYFEMSRDCAEAERLLRERD